MILNNNLWSWGVWKVVAYKIFSHNKQFCFKIIDMDFIQDDSFSSFFVLISPSFNAIKWSNLTVTHLNQTPEWCSTLDTAVLHPRSFRRSPQPPLQLLGRLLAIDFCSLVARCSLVERGVSRWTTSPKSGEIKRKLIIHFFPWKINT